MIFGIMGKLLGSIRPHLLALVGVVAVCGVATAIIAGVYVRQQRQTIEQQDARLRDKMAQINGLITANNHMIELREIEQRNAQELEAKLESIESHHVELTAEIRRLEATNAEVKEYLSRRIPADLRRLLEQR